MSVNFTTLVLLAKFDALTSATSSYWPLWPSYSYIYIKSIACSMRYGIRRFTASNRLQPIVTIPLKPWWLNDVEAWLHAQTRSSQRLFDLRSCPSQAIEEALPECLPERSWRCSTSQTIHWTAIRVLQRLEVDLETTASASV